VQETLWMCAVHEYDHHLAHASEQMRGARLDNAM
jgi:hypothetical protein